MQLSLKLMVILKSKKMREGLEEEINHLSLGNVYFFLLDLSHMCPNITSQI
jgi:hypothetical protein